MGGLRFKAPDQEERFTLLLEEARIYGEGMPPEKMLRGGYVM